jgi:hypothetical protein
MGNFTSKILSVKTSFILWGMGAALYCCFATILYYFFGEFSALMTGSMANIFALTNVLVFLIIAWHIAKFSRMAPLIGLLIFLIERSLMWWHHINFSVATITITIIIAAFFLKNIHDVFIYCRADHTQG